MTDTYCTVAERGHAEFEVQGSEFIGYIAPVTSVGDAEQFIEEIQTRHDDATHNVPAYRIRDAEFLREYSRDDGEPAGSAGKPIMNVLTGQELENVVVVVTRYFGGTELGIGGLVSAYSKATTAAIDCVGTVKRRPQTTVTVECAYDDSGTVRGILESADVAFDATYDTTVVFTVQTPTATVDSLVNRLKSATSGRVSVDPPGKV